jgi:dCTP diphosphatase
MSIEPRLIDVSALEMALQQFADDRDWNQYHSPKNLAMALTGETGGWWRSSSG